MRSTGWFANLYEMSAERERVATFGRLENGLRDAGDWYHWGPYLSERQWGTVREDYSEGGTAWEYLSHDHARSRAYRWGEDGLAGFSDIEQRLCLALTLWNGHDPILKERIFGLTGNEGNHGEDAKEYWWYLDALPSHAWNRWRYHYPQREFPYADLVAENGRRGKLDPEYELLDTGVFDEDRYWIVEVDYAKADPHDLLMSITVTNAGPDTETLTRPADGLVPEHLVVGRRRREARAAGGAGWADRHRAPVPRVARARLRRRARRPAVRERDEHGASLRRAGHAVPEGWDQRSRCRRSGERRRRVGYEGRVLARGDGRPGRERDGARAASAADGREPVVRLRRRRRGAPRRGRRVLRRADPRRGFRGRSARAPPGSRGNALEQAALRLRRGALARGRPDAAGATRVPAQRPKRRLAHVRRLRHHVDAGQVGVPLVRGVGQCVPLRRARARRSRVREVPADAALP